VLTGAPIEWVWGTYLDYFGRSIFGEFTMFEDSPCKNSMFKNATLCNMHWQRRCNMATGKCRREIDDYTGEKMNETAASNYAAYQRLQELRRGVQEETEREAKKAAKAAKGVAKNAVKDAASSANRTNGRVPNAISAGWENQGWKQNAKELAEEAEREAAQAWNDVHQFPNAVGRGL
jgi:hypothetical protein